MAPAHRGQRVPHRRPAGPGREGGELVHQDPPAGPRRRGLLRRKVDGIYGPKTVAAVEALQEANGLPQTGTLDKATEKALRSELAAKGGAAAQEETASTAAVQQSLKLAGYWDGPVDGVWTDELTTALEKLQKDLGVKVTGTVDAATIAAVQEAIAELGAAPSPSPSVTASPQPTTTS